MATWRNDGGADVCLDRARERVVPCDSTEAGWLLVAAGGEIPLEDAKKYGLGESKEASEPTAAADAEAADESKARKAAPADKARKVAPADKGR